MAEIKWIKITTDVFDDTKIRMLEALPSGDSLIVIWFKILALCGKTNMGGLLMFTEKMPYTDEMLASIFNRDIVLVKTALQTFEEFGMIETLENAYYVPNWEKHQNIDGMEKIREQNRLRKQRQRARDKEALLLEDVSRDSHTDVTQQNKNKNKDKDNNSAFADALFEKLWELYPKKRGKSSVKPATRKKLLDVGETEMIRAVKRYAEECKGKDVQYIMNGSTFFNGRYEDYLGDDYMPIPTGTVKPTNKPYVPEPPRYQKFEKEEHIDAVPMPKELREKKERLLRGMSI